MRMPVHALGPRPGRGVRRRLLHFTICHPHPWSYRAARILSGNSTFLPFMFRLRELSTSLMRVPIPPSIIPRSPNKRRPADWAEVVYTIHPLPPSSVLLSIIDDLRHVTCSSADFNSFLFHTSPLVLQCHSTLLALHHRVRFKQHPEIFLIVYGMYGADRICLSDLFAWTSGVLSVNSVPCTLALVPYR